MILLSFFVDYSDQAAQQSQVLMPCVWVIFFFYTWYFHSLRLKLAYAELHLHERVAWKSSLNLDFICGSSTCFGSNDMSWNIVCIRGEIEVRDVQLFELEFALFQYFTNLYISEEDIMPFLSIYLLCKPMVRLATVPILLSVIFYRKLAKCSGK